MPTDSKSTIISLSPQQYISQCHPHYHPTICPAIDANILSSPFPLLPLLYSFWSIILSVVLICDYGALLNSTLHCWLEQKRKIFQINAFNWLNQYYYHHHYRRWIENIVQNWIQTAFACVWEREDGCWQKDVLILFSCVAHCPPP